MSAYEDRGGWSDGVLLCLGLAVLLRRDDGTYALRSPVPHWYTQTLGEEGELSDFLANFLIDADAFWPGRDAGPLVSGEWTQSTTDGRDLRLQASAQRLHDGGQAVLVHLLPDAPDEHGRLLQTVRENSLRLREMEIARKAAEAATAAKSSFLATMSHEIRTPLNGIVGTASVLITQPDLPESARDHVALIQRSSEILMALINDILDFSKIEAGRLDLERVPLSLQTCVGEVLEMTAGHARDKGITIATRLASDLPSQVLGDPTRVRQILLNLVNNAIKFTPPRGTVSISVDVADGVTRMAVRDTGIGIDPADQASLFQAFHQVDASTTRKFGGTGLGLAICRNLAEAMGGRIRLESTRGVGSTFTVEIPFTPAAPAAAPSRPAEAIAVPAAGGGRVLVVDDNLFNQRVARMMLDRLGYQADVASSGAEALAMIEAVPYGLILMDVQMPEMDGLEVTRRLRAREASRTTIVGLTAAASASDVQECLDSGMDDVLTKPLKIERMAAMLTKFIPRA